MKSLRISFDVRRTTWTGAFVLFALVAWSQVGLADTVTPTAAVINGVVVYAAASSQSESAGLLRPGEHATWLQSVPNWYQIRLADGTTGFVSKAWTQLVPDAAGPTF